MKTELQPDPFTLHAFVLSTGAAPPAVPDHAVESAWFDAPPRSSRASLSSRPPRSVPSPPAPPIDDDVADAWFR